MFAVPVNFTVRLPSGRKIPIGMLAGLVPARCWETRSCGPGGKGHRDYQWAWAATASPQHWALIRRSISDPSEVASSTATPRRPPGATRPSARARQRPGQRRRPTCGLGYWIWPGRHAGLDHR